MEASEPFRVALNQLKDILPEAVFPDVYILMGAMTSAGTLHESGLLIGFEMNAMGPNVPTDELSSWHKAIIGPPNALPALIIHELIHYQQAVLGLTFYEKAQDKKVAVRKIVGITDSKSFLELSGYLGGSGNQVR